MHKVFEDFRKKVQFRNSRQFKVIEISNRIQRALGITDHEIKELEFESGKLEVGDYWVIACQREFNPWLTLLEITEKGLQGDPGVDHNPSWLAPEFATSTSTTNVPPEDVVDLVIDILEVTKD